MNPGLPDWRACVSKGSPEWDRKRAPGCSSGGRAMAVSVSVQWKSVALSCASHCSEGFLTKEQIRNQPYISAVISEQDQDMLESLITLEV